MSRPESPLASLPPDVDVPLPLGFDRATLPVVVPVFGAVPGVAELAAGSPVIDPRPLGLPCACAKFVEKTRIAGSKTKRTLDFMGHAFRLSPDNPRPAANVPKYMVSSRRAQRSRSLRTSHRAIRACLKAGNHASECNTRPRVSGNAKAARKKTP